MTEGHVFDVEAFIPLLEERINNADDDCRRVCDFCG